MVMKNKQQLSDGIVNPFSDDFIEHWNFWKDYRWQEHKFKYKGVFSEQAALMKLNDISLQNEKEAIEIIKESMANGWKGFFERKNKINGKPNTATRDANRTAVQAELDRILAVGR